MEYKYNPSDFWYPINEDMIKIYKAKEKYDKDSSDSRNFYWLETAIYDFSLTLKSERVCGTLDQSFCDELNEYFWGFL